METTDIYIFDTLFQDKNIDDFLNFSMDDVDADSSQHLLVLDQPSPAYLSWTAEAQPLIATFPPPPQHHHHTRSALTVNHDTSNDAFAASADHVAANPLHVGSDDASSFPCDDDLHLDWLSNFVEESYSPTNTATVTCADVPTNTAPSSADYSTLVPNHFQTAAIINPVVKDRAYDDPDCSLLYVGHRYRTHSPVSVLDRAGGAPAAAATTSTPLLIQLPNPAAASTYSSSSSSSPTSSSCSGAVVSGIMRRGQWTPPESFLHARGRAPRTKRSRPAAPTRPLVPIVAPSPPQSHCAAPTQPLVPIVASSPPQSHCAAPTQPLVPIVAPSPPQSHCDAPPLPAAATDHLLPVPDSSNPPIYIPVPRPSSTATQSTTTTPTLPPFHFSAHQLHYPGITADPKNNKKIKLTITSSAAADGPIQPHAATGARKCMHCGIQKTPQWRAGPMGPKTLCNACGVRYKSGRLFPEYRPAASPTFVAAIHSNSHKKVVEMRNKVRCTNACVPAGAPVSSKGCDLLNYIRGAAKTHRPAPAAAAGTANRDS